MFNFKKKLSYTLIGVSSLIIGCVSDITSNNELDAYGMYKQDKNATNAFAYLYQVAMHPRCANCHGVIENGVHRPTVGDDRHIHPMNISSVNNVFLQKLGNKIVKPKGSEQPVNCATCHQLENGTLAGSPPGAANELMPGFTWHMPAVTMAMPKDISAQTLCNRWLDPSQNSSHLALRGGKDDLKTFKKEFLDHHASIDPLVIWAWEPGIGRVPAPGSHKEFVDAMGSWIAGGAPCPENG